MTCSDGCASQPVPTGVVGRLGGVADLAHQLEVELVDELQHRRRVARLRGRLLDRRRGDALGQHRDALVDERPDHARGEEAARVVDQDRRLADLLGHVQRAVDRLVGGLLALDDLQQRHLVHRAEEVQADESRRIADVLGQLGDRQGRGVGAEQRALGQMRLDLGVHLGLDGRVLEDGLDHQVGARGGRRIRRGGDQRRGACRPSPGSSCRAPRPWPRASRCSALPRSAAAWSTSLRTTSMPALAHT